MELSEDFSKLEYKTVAKKCDVILIKTLDVTTMDPDWLIRDTARTASLASTDENTDYDLLKVIAYGNFTITNNRGETLNYNDGYITGDMEILDEDFVDSGDENYVEFIYKVNKSDSYTFKSEDTRSGCTVENGDTYISVNADNADNIVLDKSAGISVKGNDLSYSAYTTTLNGNMFAVSGETKESLDINFNRDGSADIQADTLKNVEFESFGDDTSYTFDGSGSVTVEENNSGGMTVTDADIHTETTFSNNIKENNGNADVTITNNTAEKQTGVAIVAEYNAGGTLVNIDTIDLSLAGNEAKTLKFTDKDVRYRAFVWDSLAGMKPLADTAELTL